MTPLLLPRRHNGDEPELKYRVKADGEGKRRIADGLAIQLALLLALGVDGMTRAVATDSLPSAGLAESVHSTLEAGLFSGIGLAEDQLAIADLSLNRQMVGATQGQWLDSTTSSTVWLINSTTSRVLGDKLIEMQEGGYSLVWLEEQLMSYFSGERVEKIAVTEVTRAFVWGAVSSYLATRAVPEIMWFTAADERVCRICRPLHLRRVPIGSGFGLIGYPPAHPYCRCWVVPVIGWLL